MRTLSSGRHLSHGNQSATIVKWNPPSRVVCSSSSTVGSMELLGHCSSHSFGDRNEAALSRFTRIISLEGWKLGWIRWSEYWVTDFIKRFHAHTQTIFKIFCFEAESFKIVPRMFLLNDFIQFRSSVCLFVYLYVCMFVSLYVWFKSGNSNLTHFQLSNCLETLQACVVWVTIQYLKKN